jgi:ketosteroid isomerase-like protein
MDTAEKTLSAADFAVAASLVEALADGDFARIATVVSDDATLSALLPGGFRQWQGSAGIAATFERWFGDAEQCDLVEASVGQLGDRVQMRWRLRVRAERLGLPPRIVEQYAYADTAPTGCIQSMSLLCSGFCLEQFDV